MTSLETPLAKAPLIGATTAKALEKAFGLRTMGDLLHFFPRRYVERGELTEIRTLTVGEEVTIIGTVERAGPPRRTSKGGAIFEAVVNDGSKGLNGKVWLTFFARNPSYFGRQIRELRVGRELFFAGTVGEFNGRRQLVHPEFEPLPETGDGDSAADEFAGALLPIYSTTKDVRSWRVGQIMRLVLPTVELPPDPIPASLRQGRRLMDLGTALREIHAPKDRESVGAARKRLKFDEALAVQTALLQRKIRAAAWPATPRPRRDDGLLATFDQTLPYELTAGQREVGDQIAADLAVPHPMNRLLQGEVGSGKTVCALRAMLQVVDAGGQAALLAPTEVLAAQHYRGIRDLLGPLGRSGELDSAETATRVALVTGSQGAAARRRELAAVASGEAGIVIGTHALLYDVVFRDLGLVVVDEQHRFGVEQRAQLRERAQPPHVLVMTATPIPRTVAMTVFGDLEVSSLTELPAGRSPIETHVVPRLEKPAFYARAWGRLREEVAAGHQAFVVCPRIGDDGGVEDLAYTAYAEDEDEGGARRAAAVLEVAPRLAAAELAGLRVGVLHGRLSGDEKDAVMREFAGGGIDVLVATTVVEVGVDVPNATVMVVLDADRFGVSQLHQLRGRIGRGSAKGVCLLVTEAPDLTPARGRLDAVAATTDGFVLADFDLEQRGEGDILGAKQSGSRQRIRLLSVKHDVELIEQAHEAAAQILAEDPELTRHPALAAIVVAMVGDDRAEFLEKA